MSFWHDDHRPEDDQEMTLIEHLQQLRQRLILAVLGLVPGVILAWMLREHLMSFLVRPLVIAYRMQGFSEPKLHFASPVDPVIAYMKIALVGGALLASPWIFYQLWAFIAPGMYRREQRLALPFVLASTLFFVGGSLFGYYVVFPLGFDTFLSFAGALPDTSLRIEPTIMVDQYLSFATQLLLAFGVVFEVPVVVTFLAIAGIVTWRQLLRFSRWWIVISTVIAAMLTPPDVTSQMVMALPLIVLYFLSIGLAYLFGPKAEND